MAAMRVPRLPRRRAAGIVEIMSSARLSLLFSAVGHSYIHMFTAFYFTIQTV